MELNATSVATAANILSLINLLGDSSIVSTSQSTSFPQDFSALLTEMTGSTVGQASIATKAGPVQVANVPQTIAAPSVPVGPNKSDDCNPTCSRGLQPASSIMSQLSAPEQGLQPST